MSKRAAAWLGLILLAAVSWAADCALAQAPTNAGIASELPTDLPTDVAFARYIALIRAHLATGDELVAQHDWRDAYPHFRFPLEEIYGVIREDLPGYKTPPFDGALRALARTVRARNARHYPNTREKVEHALATADMQLKARQPNWPSFELRVALETLKTASEEYEEALIGERIAHPVGYQTARGFMLQAGRMVESVASDLSVKDSAALTIVRDGFSQLKQTFVSVSAPKRPPIKPAALQGLVSRIELAADKLI